MFDTMTLTKIGGALCGSLLIFLLIDWAAETVYSTEAGHGEHAKAAYVIEVDEEDTTATVDQGPGIADLIATADVAKGERVFSKCKACHKLQDGVNATGPSLFGVSGRDIASVAGFGYSGTLTGLDGTWTPEALDGFLTSPKKYAPGTKMGFAGLKKITDRANVIAYLQTFGN